jgi:hypothetical protein
VAANKLFDRHDYHLGTGSFCRITGRDGKLWCRIQETHELSAQPHGELMRHQQQLRADHFVEEQQRRPRGPAASQHCGRH